LLAHPSFHEDLFHAMEQSFVETDVAYLEEDARVKNDDGCTGTAAVIVGRRLVVAHVGDSRAVLGHNGEAIALTDDHKPNRPDERQRIEDVGGTVVHAGTWRVGGVLAVSRSFGNRCMKTYILAKPQIREDALHAGSACLIVASDGLWDVVSNAEAVEFVLKFPEAEAAARGLAALAYDRGSYDNISCCIAKFAFKDEEGNESQANGGEGPVRAVDTAAKVGARVAAEGGIATD
jgi:protein phosphatase 1L